MKTYYQVAPLSAIHSGRTSGCSSSHTRWHLVCRRRYGRRAPGDTVLIVAQSRRTWQALVAESRGLARTGGHLVTLRGKR